MSKQLRLDVAQLTDVGRKRPHNEDNMAYVIPKDPQVMARKGALFIVADGMGGHAAGEVASEIAVDTVSKAYYQDDSDDVAVSLLHAIRRANTLIHQRAAESVMRSGMGTTCVTAVLRGGTAYIANVGDSRAYMVRRGAVRQVSQDHSWVEEQVRAGLLTKDQARSHAQRNVITRCLGTQPDVEIDVFSERLEEGDSFVLCSDGLSGFVADEELRAMVDQYVPQESVYHLIERANENGGPDNITAIVMRVQEVGWEPPSSGVPHPVHAGGREMDEDTAVIGQFRGSPLGALPPRSNDGRIATGPLQMPSGPLISPKSDTAPQPAIRLSRSRRNRLLYPTLAIFLILVVALVGGGAYYLWHLYRTQADVDASLTSATTLVGQAKSEVTSNPADALQKLNVAQKDLFTVQSQSSSLTDAQRRRLATLTEGDFLTTVKQAISGYNAQFSILSLPCPTTSTPVIDGGSANTQPASISAVRNGKNTSYYALGEDHNLYQLNDQHSLANKINLPGNAQPIMITSDDTRLLVLASVPAQQKTPAGFTLYTILPNEGGKTNDTTSIDSALTKNGRVPSLIAASGKDVYVVLTPANAPAAATILDYTLNGDKFQGTPRNATISLSTGLVSIAAFPQNQLFLLFDNGDVQSLPFAAGNQSPVSVVVQSQPALAPVLATSARDFTPATPVPVPGGQPASALSVLSVPRATLLASATISNTSHLYIGDGATHRVLDLVVATSGTTTGAATPTSTPTKGGVGAQVKLQLFQQYTSARLLANMKSITVDPAGAGLYLLAQSTQSNATLNLVSVNTTKADPNTCSAA